MELIKNTIEENILINKKLLNDTAFHNQIMQIYKIFKDCILSGGKIIACGNGGSAADASHFATELIGKFKLFSNPYPAISLNSDSILLTALANDYQYEDLFVRQIIALMTPKDALLAISTSGSSHNIIKAIECANKIGGKTVLLTGSSYIKDVCPCDLVFSVPSKNVPRIQECHTMILHMVCELLEKNLH